MEEGSSSIGNLTTTNVEVMQWLTVRLGYNLLLSIGKCPTNASSEHRKKMSKKIAQKSKFILVKRGLLSSIIR